MKFRWLLRKNSSFPIFGFVFALLALVFSYLQIRLTTYFDFQFPVFMFRTAKQSIESACCILGLVNAAVLSLCTLLYCFGKGRKLLVLSSFMLLMTAIARFAADYYITLYIRALPFRPFSPTYLDIVFSFLLLIVLIMTDLRLVRNVIPATAVSFLFGIVAPVCSLLRLGFYGSADLLNLSAVVASLCGCTAITLCLLTWEGRITIAAKAPVKEEPIDYIEPIQPQYSAPIPQSKPIDLQQTVLEEVEESVLKAVEAPEFVKAPVPEVIIDEPAPKAVAEPVEAVQQMPYPEEGCVWEQIDVDQNGTPIFAQRRIYTDVKTGKQTAGALLPIFFPYTPKNAQQYVPVQPAPVQPTPVQAAPVQSVPVQPVQSIPVQPAPVQAAPAALTPSIAVDQLDSFLQKLQTLHDCGILNDEEFAAKCRQVLGL